ncbi:hypothetical protein ACLKA7_010423 [Drosophila subpalustris]
MRQWQQQQQQLKRRLQLQNAWKIYPPLTLPPAPALALALAPALLWLHFSGSPTQCPPATAASPAVSCPLPAPVTTLCTTMSVHNTTREGYDFSFNYSSSSDSSSDYRSYLSHPCPVLYCAVLCCAVKRGPRHAVPALC